MWPLLKGVKEWITFSRNIFFRKLGLSKLLVECVKVSTGLRENEVNADFRSCQKIPVTYNPNSPMLKTTVESCTRRMFTKFETKFKHNFFINRPIVTNRGVNFDIHDCPYKIFSWRNSCIQHCRYDHKTFLQIVWIYRCVHKLFFEGKCTQTLNCNLFW